MSARKICFCNHLTLYTSKSAGIITHTFPKVMTRRISETFKSFLSMLSFPDFL